MSQKTLILLLFSSFASLAVSMESDSSNTSAKESSLSESSDDPEQVTMSKKTRCKLRCLNGEYAIYTCLNCGKKENCLCSASSEEGSAWLKTITSLEYGACSFTGLGIGAFAFGASHGWVAALTSLGILSQGACCCALGTAAARLYCTERYPLQKPEHLQT